MPASGENVVVFGTGVLGRRLAYYLTHDSDHTVVAFTLHDEFHSDTALDGLPVVPFGEVTELYRLSWAC